MDWYWQQSPIERDRDLRWWNEDAIPRRLTVAVGSALGALVFTLGLLLVAGGVLVSQAVLLFLCALAPLVFVLALWPGVGIVLLKRWGRATLRAGVGQVVSVALLAVATAMFQLAGTLEGTLGWEAVLFLLAAMAVSVALVWRVVMLRWVRTPGVVPAAGVAAASRAPSQALPAPVRQVLRAPVWQGEPRQPRDEVAERTPVASVQAPSGVEVTEAFTQELAANRARMLLDMQRGRFAERPQGITVGNHSDSTQLHTRVNETVRVTDISKSVTERVTAPESGTADRGTQAASVNTVVREHSAIRRQTAIPLMTRRPH